jgi:hypothetical protein
MSKLTQDIVLLIYIRKVVGSNLNRNTGYADWGVSSFSSVPLGKCWCIVSIMSGPLSFKSSPIRPSSNSLPLDAMWSSYSTRRYRSHKNIKQCTDVNGVQKSVVLKLSIYCDLGFQRVVPDAWSGLIPTPWTLWTKSSRLLFSCRFLIWMKGEVIPVTGSEGS